MKRYFITGTDTDCGKTYVTGCLLDYFHRQKIKAMALKPVASGCVRQNGQLVSFDVESLMAHQPQVEDSIYQWLFEPPVSPHIAAAEVSQEITARAISDFCTQAHFEANDCLLIEGAGGLMVPINDNETWVEFLKIMSIPTIFVVGIRLGCINHALLTETALMANDLECCGWIANFLEPESLRQEENLQTLRHKIKAPLLGRVGFNDGFAPAENCQYALIDNMAFQSI